MECEVLIHNCSVTVPKGNQCQVGSKYGHSLLFRGNRCSALIVACCWTFRDGMGHAEHMGLFLHMHKYKDEVSSTYV